MLYNLEKIQLLTLIGSDVKVNGIVNGLTIQGINAYALKWKLCS